MPGFSQDLSQLGTDGRGTQCQAAFKIHLLCGLLSKSRVLKEDLLCLCEQKLFRIILTSCGDKQTCLIHSAAVLHKRLWNMVGPIHRGQQVKLHAKISTVWMLNLPQGRCGATEGELLSEAQNLSWCDVTVAFVHQRILEGSHASGKGFDD